MKLVYPTLRWVATQWSSYVVNDISWVSHSTSFQVAHSPETLAVILKINPVPESTAIPFLFLTFTPTFLSCFVFPVEVWEPWQVVPHMCFVHFYTTWVCPDTVGC